MTVASYDDFKQIIKDLEVWNPNSQYISKNLTLKNKPKKNTCCQRFFSIFRASKSSQAVTAAKLINAYATTYATELSQDKDTVRSLKKFNKGIHKNLIENNAPHRLKSNKKLTQLDKQCKTIHGFCKDWLKSKTPSQSSISFTSSESSSIPLRTPNKLSLDNSRASKDNSRASNSPIKAHDVSAPTSIKAKKINPFKNSKDLKNFISQMNPASPEEATELFEGLKYALANSNLKKVLDTANGNALLIKINEIKHNFAPDKKAEPRLRKAALHLRIEIRKRFFADRIKKMKAQVKVIEGNVDASLRRGSAVPDIINDWKSALRKFKPISIPKYYHCTQPQYVNLIIQHSEGIVSQPVGISKKGFDGAFASSIPEQGKLYGYGPFCFAISDYVEERALNDKKAPMVTNINNFGQGFDNTREPIYVGKAAPQTQKDPSSHHGRPKIWFGFKQSILLRKTDKSQNPLEYYRNTTFSLFAHMADGPRANEEFAQIDDVSLKDLADRKIRILHADDFKEIVELIDRSFHFVLPQEWGTEVKEPDGGCGNTPKKPGVTLYNRGVYITSSLKDLQGVQA